MLAENSEPLTLRRVAHHYFHSFPCSSWEILGLLCLLLKCIFLSQHFSITYVTQTLNLKVKLAPQQDTLT